MDDNSFKFGNNVPNKINLQQQICSVRNPIEHIYLESVRRNDEILKGIEEKKKQEKTEELKRHTELIQALKNAGNDNTIIVGDHVTGVQIQQNTNKSNQKMEISQSFDYEKTYKILKEIEGYFNFPQFNETFNEHCETVKTLVEETINAVEARTEPLLIKKSLAVIRDLSIGVSGSLIASGILGLLSGIVF